MDGFLRTITGNESVPEGDERPRSRDSLFLLAKLTIGGREPGRDVRVRNLSAGGLMAEFDGVVAIGDPVEVDLRGIGPVAGRVAWAAEGRIGVALDQPIDPKKARKPVGTRPAKPV